MKVSQASRTLPLPTMSGTSSSFKKNSFMLILPFTQPRIGAVLRSAIHFDSISWVHSVAALIRQLCLFHRLKPAIATEPAHTKIIKAKHVTLRALVLINPPFPPFLADCEHGTCTCGVRPLVSRRRSQISHRFTEN